MRMLFFIIAATLVLLTIVIYIDEGRKIIRYRITLRYLFLDRRCPFCHKKMKKKITKCMGYYKRKWDKNIIVCYRLIPEFKCPTCSYNVKISNSSIIRS